MENAELSARYESLVRTLDLGLPSTLHAPIARIREQATRVAQKLAIPEQTEGVAALLRQAFESLGCSVSSQTGSFDAFLKRARDALPAVVVSNTSARWCLVTDVGIRGAWVTDPRDGAQRWLNSSTLSSVLGETAAECVWMTIDDARPLEVLRANESHDAHGHHDTGLTPSARLGRMLRADRRDIVVVLLYALGVGLMSLVTPVAVQALVNTVAFGALLQPVVVLTVAVLLGLGFAGAMRAMQTLVVEVIQQRVFVRVAVDLAWRLPRVHAEAFSRNHGPELVNRFFDVLTVQKAAASLLLEGVAVVLTTAVGMMVMSFYHPALLAFDTVLVAAIVFVTFVLGWNGQKTAIKESKAKYAVAGWLEEVARHPVAFKAAGGARLAVERADELAQNYLSARRKHFTVVFRQVVGSLALQALVSAALLALGGYLVISRSLTLGQLIAAELIVTAVVEGVTKLGKHLESFYDLLAAVDKLGHLVDMPLERDDGTEFESSTQAASLQLREVSFAYPEGNVTVLSDASLNVRAGERVALTGGDGAGKTTLVDLLYGLRTVDSGSVLVDEVDVREMTLEALRETVAVVKDPEIFEGTIADNVRMGRPEVTDAMVRQSLRSVGLDSDLARLPNGLLTRVATDAPSLSRGQVRRIAIARALVGKPRLLVLDGLLDTLDQAGRERVLNGLRESSRSCTVIVVTHNEQVARQCDRTIRMENGRFLAA